MPRGAGESERLHHRAAYPVVGVFHHCVEESWERGDQARFSHLLPLTYKF